MLRLGSCFGQDKGLCDVTVWSGLILSFVDLVREYASAVYDYGRYRTRTLSKLVRVMGTVGMIPCRVFHSSPYYNKLRAESKSLNSLSSDYSFAKEMW